MRKLVVFPFRLGESVSEDVNNTCQSHYIWLAKKVANESCELTVKKCKTIPISNYSMQHGSTNVHTAIARKIEKLQPSSYVFLIDVYSRAGIIDARIVLSLAQEIASLVEKFSANAPSESELPKVVVLLPEMPPPTDECLAPLQNLINKQRVVIVCDDGAMSKDGLLGKLSDDEYIIKITNARGEPSDFLKKKMIRRLGHFKRQCSDGSTHCVRYFYDGTLCEPELAYLIKKHIATLAADVASVQLLYHCPQSDWLERVVLAISENNKPINLEKINEDQLKSISYDKSSKPLLIVDLVDTGNTINALIEKILDNADTKELPDVLAVLAVNTAKEASMSRELLIRKKKLSIKYLMAVTQKRFESDKCPMCSLKLPFSLTDSEDYCYVTAHDHWEMAFDVGLKQEDDPPKPRRSEKPYVINYPKMLSRNGAWLASKVKQRLYNRPEGYPSDILLVCPANEKGSQVFSGYLRLMLECDIVEIPRDIIEEFMQDSINPTEKIQELAKEVPDWYKALSASVKSEIIVIDEFNASGGTCIGIMRILHELGRFVVCYFPLNDLNPAWSLTQKFNVYSLYEWQSGRATI